MPTIPEQLRSDTLFAPIRRYVRLRRSSLSRQCANAPRDALSTLFLIATYLLAGTAAAIDIEPGLHERGIRLESSRSPDSPLLHEEEFVSVEQAMDCALAHLARNQQADGSFAARVLHAQPAITSLSVMAFLARGHLPGEGPYGAKIEQALQYIISCQQESGLFVRVPPGPVFRHRFPSHAACYNHAIAGVTLAEIYGLAGAEQAAGLAAVIDQAVQHTIAIQIPRSFATYRGGWGY